MKITEGQFVGFIIVLVIALSSIGMRGMFLDDVDTKNQKIAFAKACEDSGFNFAVMNGNWVCVGRVEVKGREG